MDSRLLALGSVAVIAAAGFVRKGSRASQAPWLHNDDRDRYAVEMVVRSENRPGEWIVPEGVEDWALGTAPTREEAQRVVEMATAFGRRMRDTHPSYRTLLAPSGTVERSSPHEIWIRACDRQVGWMELTDIQSFVAGYEDDMLALLLYYEILEQWPKQRVSFRTFAPGETP